MLTDAEILKSLNLKMPEAPEHYTEAQRSGEAPPPYAVRAGMGVGAFTEGLKILCAAFVPAPMARTATNFSYGMEVGKVTTQVRHVRKRAQVLQQQHEEQEALAPNNLEGATA